MGKGYKKILDVSEEDLIRAFGQGRAMTFVRRADNFFVAYCPLRKEHLLMGKLKRKKTSSVLTIIRSQIEKDRLLGD